MRSISSVSMPTRTSKPRWQMPSRTAPLSSTLPTKRLSPSQAQRRSGSLRLAGQFRVPTKELPSPPSPMPKPTGTMSVVDSSLARSTPTGTFCRMPSPPYRAQASALSVPVPSVRPLCSTSLVLPCKQSSYRCPLLPLPLPLQQSVLPRLHPPHLPWPPPQPLLHLQSWVGL